MPLSSRTCELSTEEAYAEVLMLCRGVSRVRTLVRPVNKKVLSRDKKAGYGENMPVPWAKYDRDLSSWRTSQVCLWGGQWDVSSETWPSSGMMHDGECTELAPWVPHIHGTGCFLWPTPATTNEFGIAWDTAKRLLMGIKTRKSGAKIGTDLKWIPCLRWLQNGGQAFKGVLNYRFSEWLMGWPRDWTVLDSQAMEWSRDKVFRRGKRSKTSQ